MPVMSHEWQIQNQKNKARWFKGNEDAINFINQLFACVELWDDLIDKDVTVTPDQVNECFLAMFVSLPNNDWFIMNRQHYTPLIVMAINGFHDANKMAKDSDKKIQNLAFHIRNMGIEIHIATAFLIGGYNHMRECSEEIRKFFAFESFEEWEMAKNG